MLISVLIVNHNGEHYLDRCLESLGPVALDAGAEAVEHLEVVLADNGSRDNSIAFVRQNYPGVKVVEIGENIGFGAANNRAAEVARGGALLLLNNDAWLADGCLDGLVGRMTQEESLALVVPQLRYPDPPPEGRLQTSWAPDVGLLGEGLRRLTNRFEGRPFNHGPLTRALQRWGSGGWFTAACALIRRRAFEQVGGFDPSFFLYFEDADLCLRLRQAGWKLAQESSALAFHEKSGSSGGTLGGLSAMAGPAIPDGARRAAVEYRRSQLLYYRRHRAPSESWLLRAYLRRKCRGVRDLGLREELLAVISGAADEG